MNILTPNQESKNCIICMELMESGQIVMLACGTLDNPHQFHPDCLQQWMVRNPTCPIDRSRIRMINDQLVDNDLDLRDIQEESRPAKIGILVFSLIVGVIIGFILFPIFTCILEFILTVLIGITIGIFLAFLIYISKFGCR